MHCFDIFAIDRIIAAITCRLQCVDQITVKRMWFFGRSQAVEPAYRQRYDILVEGGLMANKRVFFEASETKARNAAVHAGKIVGDERTRESQRLEIVPAPIGRNYRNSHL